MIFDSANNNRSIVASRAAEIIMEEGVTDYLFAKRKAAKSLGLLTNDNLPSNHEIDNALKEYRNIFQEQVDSETIVKIKKEALNIMTLFKDFNPHLTGQLLEGLIPKFPKIQINLFTDNLKEVEYILLNKNIACSNIHGDLSLGNVIIDNKDDFYIIDWELSIFGPIVYDLFKIIMHKPFIIPALKFYLNEQLENNNQNIKNSATFDEQLTIARLIFDSRLLIDRDLENE